MKRRHNNIRIKRCTVKDLLHIARSLQSKRGNAKFGGPLQSFAAMISYSVRPWIAVERKTTKKHGIMSRVVAVGSSKRRVQKIIQYARDKEVRAREAAVHAVIESIQNVNKNLRRGGSEIIALIGGCFLVFAVFILPMLLCFFDEQNRSKERIAQIHAGISASCSVKIPAEAQEEFVEKSGSITQADVEKIMAKVQENKKKLDTCSRPHTFAPVKQQLFSRCVCSKCGGEVSFEGMFWYKRGLEDGRK